MFGDMHLVLAWFGFIFLMLLFKVPFSAAGGKPGSGRRLHSPHVFPSAPLHRPVHKSHQR